MSKSVNFAVSEIISEKLREIAQEEDVIRLYACEAGSRLWGIESNDSDYDVRFIYLAPIEHHLTVMNAGRRDTIERRFELPDGTVLDMAGWEFGKAVFQAGKFSAALMEWLRSPYVYAGMDPLVRQLETFCLDNVSPKQYVYHYLNLAREHYHRYINKDYGANYHSDQISIKKYLYTIRSILCARWYVNNNKFHVPLYLRDLIANSRLDNKHRKVIEKLIELKSGESSTVSRFYMLDDFIELNLAGLNTALKDVGGLTLSKADRDHLDTIYRDAVKLSWETSLWG